MKIIIWNNGEWLKLGNDLSDQRDEQSRKESQVLKVFQYTVRCPGQPTQETDRFKV